MADRYEALKRAALVAMGEPPMTGEGHASAASMDDADGDRGDVAPPATQMPRSMASRCMSCGKDMSTNTANGDYCNDHAMDEELGGSPAPHLVPRPGGSITKPRPPMTKDGSQGKPTALGGPGSGPQPGGGKLAKAGGKLKAVLRGVKDAAKEIGHGIVNQYHIPQRDAKGNRPEDRDVRGPINDTAKGRDPWD